MFGSLQMGLQFRLSKLHFNAVMDFDSPKYITTFFYAIQFYNLQSPILIEKSVLSILTWYGWGRECTFKLRGRVCIVTSQNISKAPEENKFSNYFVSSLFIFPPTDLSEKPLQKRPTTRCLIFGQKNFPNKVPLATVKEFENNINDNFMKV